jgi:transposase InsO family protein
MRSAWSRSFPSILVLTQKDVEGTLERVDPTLNGKGPCTRRERTCTRECKGEAVQLAQSSQIPSAHIARDLGIADNTLTKVCTDRTHFQSRREARATIFEYVGCFSNHIRLHSMSQYGSPMAFEQANASQMSESPTLESPFFLANSRNERCMD